MKLTTDRQAFAAVLGQAAKHAVARTTITALSTVLLRAGDGEIEVTATNLDHVFKATTEARVETEGSIAANADLLAGFVHGAAGTEVDLALDGALLKMRSGHVRGRLPTIAAADFPVLFASPPGLVFDIDGAVLVATLDAVGYAVSKDDTRYYLSGTSWLIRDGRLELCATDGHILSTIGIDAPAGAEGLKPMIVPDLAMPAFTGPVHVEVADTWIRFAGDAAHRVSITSKLIDGTFPDYKRIIRPATATATAARKELAEAVGRCMPLCKVSRAPLYLIHDTEGELLVRVLAADGAELEDRVDIEGSQFTLSLSGSLLAATLASFDGETIEIGLAGIGDNVRISEPGNDHRLAIIMPMASTALPYRVGPPIAAGAATKQAAE